FDRWARGAWHRDAARWAMNRTVRCMLILLLFPACAGPSVPPRAQPERVFAFDPPTWFEDALTPFRVTPNGRFAVYASRPPRWIELASGTVDARDARRGLDGLTAIAVQPDGTVLLLGELSGQSGWFDAGPPPRVLQIPSNAQYPQWSPDHTR